MSLTAIQDQKSPSFIYV